MEIKIETRGCSGPAIIILLLSHINMLGMFVGKRHDQTTNLEHPFK